VISEVPSALIQGLAHVLVNAKLITLIDVGGAIGASLEACVSLIRRRLMRGVMLGAFGAMPLACTSNSSPSQARFKE
jgi:hypothetical protein